MNKKQGNGENSPCSVLGIWDTTCVFQKGSVYAHLSHPGLH